MPWTHCDLELTDDQTSCPSCGATKASWTLELDSTRAFTIARAPGIGLKVIAGEDRPVAGEPFEVELPDGSVVEGETDSNGAARVRVPDGGRCRLTFTARPAGQVTRLPDEGEETSGEGGDAPASEGERGEPARFELEARSARYVFQAPLLAVVRLRFGGEALASAPFEARVGQARFTGETDEEGALSVELPVGEGEDLPAVALLLGEGEEAEAFVLEPGLLEPADEVVGAQGRLRNLGYLCGELDGELGELTRAALREFQRAHELDPTGELDEATAARLEEVYREGGPGPAPAAPSEGEGAPAPAPHPAAVRPSFPLAASGLNTIELSEGAPISV